MTLDPVATNPDHYSVIFENDHVRVLEYLDQPGDRTIPHEHPNSVMVTLSSFSRRLYAGDEERDVHIRAEKVLQAISESLPLVLEKTGAEGELSDDLLKRIPEVVSWITWAELDTVVARQLSSMKIEDPSLCGTVERLATAVSTAIAVHS